MMNNLAPLAGGQNVAPRLRVSANGTFLPWPVSATVSLYNNYRAGTFSVTVALKDTDQMNMAWWTSVTNVKLAVYFDLLPAASAQPLIVGNVDNIEADFNANSVTLTGRDLSALLIDTKTADLYQNQTSSEIIAALAATVPGLKTAIQPTTTPVGQFYAYDHVRTALGGFSRAITQWDLATYLAQNEGFDIFVAGTSLYFQPPQSGAAPYALQWAKSADVPSSNVIDVRPSRSLTIAKGVAVTVKSWASSKRSPIIATAGSAGDEGQTYVIYKPNLTLAQAQQLANQRLAQITRFEKKLDIEMPGELNLTPQMVMQFSGTGTGFDGLYYPDEVTRSLSFDEGFTQTVTALNHPPVNQASSIPTTGANTSGL